MPAQNGTIQRWVQIGLTVAVLLAGSVVYLYANFVTFQTYSDDRADILYELREIRKEISNLR